MSLFKKNTAVTGFPFHLVALADGSDVTTGTPVGYYLLDGATQTAIADVTPVHEGNGEWSFDLTAGEMNGDVVGLTFVHTLAITAHFTIKTDTKVVSDLNDIAATAIVSAGAITTSGGNVANVTLTDTLTTYTNNTPQTGDTFAQLPTNFSDLAVTITTGLVSVGTNNDKTGYTVSTVSDKTGYSISGAITTLDGLNNVAATDIVSAGAITTSGGNVANVTLTDTLTTYTSNTPQTGDTFAQLPTNFSDMAVTITTGYVSVGTNTDKTGYSISGAITTLDGLNNVAATDIVSAGAITTSGGNVAEVTLVTTTTTNTDMLTATAVNAEVVDALTTDTYAEPGQGTPLATTSIQAKIGYLYKNWRNHKDESSTTFQLYNDDATTVDQKATVSDSGTVADKTEITGGP